MTARLRTLARQITEALPGYTCTVQEGFCNTDRKIGRLRWPGKGRTGTRLIVRDPSGAICLDHNSAETYRTNQEVVDWLDRMRRP